MRLGFRDMPCFAAHRLRHVSNSDSVQSCDFRDVANRTLLENGVMSGCAVNRQEPSSRVEFQANFLFSTTAMTVSEQVS